MGTDHENLLDAVDAAARAERAYMADELSYREYARAMDHVAVMRDKCNLSFFRIVRVPERTPMLRAV